MYKVIIKDKEYIIKDVWCIAEAVKIATTQYYADTKDSDDTSIIVIDIEENVSYKWDRNEKEWCKIHPIKLGIIMFLHKWKLKYKNK